MKRFILVGVVFMLSLTLLSANVWAKSKAEKNKADIKNMNGGLPALERRVSAIEDAGGVQGPPGEQGPQGIQGPAGADLPAGLSLQRLLEFFLLFDRDIGREIQCFDSQYQHLYK